MPVSLLQPRKIIPRCFQNLASAGVRVCIDGVSSLGAVPMDLRGVHLVTGSSGKALGAYADGTGSEHTALASVLGVASPRHVMQCRPMVESGAPLDDALAVFA